MKRLTPEQIAATAHGPPNTAFVMLRDALRDILEDPDTKISRELRLYALVALEAAVPAYPDAG